jgi:hypothetical protein
MEMEDVFTRLDSVKKLQKQLLEISGISDEMFEELKHLPSSPLLALVHLIDLLHKLNDGHLN